MWIKRVTTSYSFGGCTRRSEVQIGYPTYLWFKGGYRGDMGVQIGCLIRSVMKSLVTILIVILLWGCNGIIPPDYPPGPPIPKDVNLEESCELACRNLKRMNCDGWKGSPGIDEIFNTKDDIPCFSVCIEIVKSDETVTLNQRCVAESISCKEADRCFEE